MRPGDLDVTITVKAAPVPKRSGQRGTTLSADRRRYCPMLALRSPPDQRSGAWLRSLGVSSGYAPPVLEVIAVASSPRRASRKAQWRGGSAH